GRFDVLPLTVDDWSFSDEHDLAAVPIDYNSARKYLFVSTNQFLTQRIAAEEDVGIGDEVFMVGRVISHDGTQKNSPSVRWSHISMMPGEPIYHASNVRARRITSNAGALKASQPASRWAASSRGDPDA